MSSIPSKEYDNGEVVITWQPEKCAHSGNCVRGLPKVFNPRKKPWIEIDNASSEQLVEQVKKCPSGALGYYFKDQSSI
ncbi:(4Fe-4S)-binding protein [Algoriphagus jejuensis]|uniref:(4Fe-4S)-binding protein n=1 Tax=Algoriphagus jejuensis TaxID=419934 RepID=A0ABP3YET2_9BACT